ncbi:leucine-rich repeat-containing protein 27 isoform X1 [Pygocentrus nattereri]|uniref:Leucine rich repeat containing 27 n=2 Tax=Pygocentrus nattereri TaxID=42514 RepID=A0A3B4DUQ5_PYGNA|nr:leucine-rich repeat-containing protein 27 isoform X1 [Pygocentrus nattereri]
MRALEEDMNDLHLSLDCGDSAEKSPSRKSSPSQEEDPSKQPGEDVTSHTLYLSRQSLKDIPDYALKCTELKNLYLEGNRIPSLPENMFTSLPNLVWLDLRNNQLTGIPADIGQHRCLKTLLLEGNPVTELPVELGNVITLRALSLRNCPVSFPSQDILQQGLAHILQFLRRKAVAQRPLSVHNTLPACWPSEASDMPVVERLPLSEVLQASVDLGEEANDSDLHRFQELQQRMIQMERADLGYLTPEIQSPRHLRAAGGDRSHPLSTRRTQEMGGMFPALLPSDAQCWKRSEERRLAAMKELKEKQAMLEQRRKDEELLREWRNQARIMQERKILEQKQDRRERLQRDENMKNTQYSADASYSERDSGEALSHKSNSDALNTLQRPQRSSSYHKETEEARVARDRDLEQRIRNHVQMMQERHRRPRGPPGVEAQAAAQEIEEVKQLQLELAERRRQRDLEYRFSAFTGESFSGSYNK